MNLLLRRKKFSKDGIFGELSDGNGKFIAHTIEHAYLTEHEYFPKVLAGEYLCTRGTHALHDGIPFETFELNKVPNCDGILIHCGNTQYDSEGCILVGEQLSGNMITNSRKTFAEFMSLQDDVDSFTLTVEDINN